jgi:UDP-N-acetylglucosamine 4,6-dehydratase
MMDLNGSSVLITGGTGSFGRKFVEIVLKRFPDIKRLIVFSRDEFKQYEMSQTFSESNYKGIRYVLGDVRDVERLKRVFEGVDVVIHAAALKQVPSAELNPMECIKTNVLGAENVINAALDKGVKVVVALSTDKAAAPVSLYGATKLCAEKLFVAANHFNNKANTKFSVMRYGNVIGSRGSVSNYFEQIGSTGILPLTDINMTRFNISLEEEVDMVLWAINNAWGGEVFVPKLSSFKISDLAKAICLECIQKEVGVRAGEKIHEELIAEAEARNVLEFDDYFIIRPDNPVWDLQKWTMQFKGRTVPKGFRYISNENKNWLNIEDLKLLLSSSNI